MWRFLVVFFVVAAGHVVAQPATMYVVVPSAVTRVINGEIRFCETENLKGNVCGRNAKVFGKKHFLVQDWWSPETYVTAAVGIENPQIVGVQPTPDLEGLVIYFGASQ